LALFVSNDRTEDQAIKIAMAIASRLWRLCVAHASRAIYVVTNEPAIINRIVALDREEISMTTRVRRVIRVNQLEADRLARDPRHHHRAARVVVYARECPS